MAKTIYRAAFIDGRKGQWRDSMTAAALDLLDGEGQIELASDNADYPDNAGTDSFREMPEEINHE